MYIANIDNSNNKYYECGRIIGKYLVKHGLPLLSVNDKGKMMFAKTEKLQMMSMNQYTLQRVILMLW